MHQHLFATPTHRMFALYGNTGDYFYTPQLRELDVNVWLLTHLKYLGYQRVVFYSPNMKIHFADAASARLARSTSGVDPAPAPSENTAPKLVAGRLQSGPLGLGRIRRAPSAAPANTPPADDTLRWHFGGMNDSQGISALDRMMREDIATAVVFQNGENLFSLLKTEDRPLWDHLLGEWVGTGLASTSRNIAVVIFRGGLDAGFWQLAMPRLFRHFFRDEARRPRSEISLCIGAGQQDEVWSLLHRLRLTGRLNWSPQRIQQESRRLAQGLVPEKLEQDITLMSTLSHTVCQGREATADEISPWEQLRQAPGLAERVEEKLRRLVADARARRQRHGTSAPEAAPRLPHAVARLALPLPLPADRLANLHLALLGGPGTGKTTLARLVAAIYREEGILESGHLVEVSSEKLIDKYIGGTAPRTAEAIARAQGGILFIDEAYSLNNNKSGREAVTELVQAMSTHQGRFAVIIAGYTHEIRQFIEGPEANPGLKSRFPESNRWELQNYDASELYRIFCTMLAEEGYALNQTLQDELPGAFERWAHSRDATHFGNARDVRNLVASLTQRAGTRCLLEKEDFSDLPGWQQWLGLRPPPDVNSLLDEMGCLVGLNTVKDAIRDLSATLAVQQHLKNASPAPGHYVFSGNPGTGKTTVARLMGRILNTLGLLERGHVVEVKREDLVGRYVGHAENNTKAKIRDARNGILFIDEAYQLAESRESGSYGLRALETLLASMENERSRLCIIMAGYPAEMQRLINTNPGFKSRITKWIVFEDFTATELYHIALNMLAEQQYQPDEAARQALAEHLQSWDTQRGQPDFGNARDVRNLVNEIIARQNRRIVPYLGEWAVERLRVIEVGDVVG